MNAAYGYHLVDHPAAAAATRWPGRYQITNVNSGLALDTSSAGTAQGTARRPGHRHQRHRQNWTLVAAGSGLYKIKNSASGLLLGITA